jgi:3-deoxy-D-manno-octulosonate 8-phosphate phosphatase KdsC-like HAD superfamily phosphatase
VFEVKSTADEEELERFNDKADLAIATLSLPGAKKALITLDRSTEVAAACKRLGIVLA